VGGASFVLAKTIPEVIGIDLSQRFIETASELAAKGRCRCGGRIYTLPENSGQEGVRFEIGNACEPDSTLGIFDLILMANLLCRLPDPAACLHALRKLTRSGSILAIMTPCSWDESFTPREKWLMPTFDALQEHLGTWCRLLNKTDMPFVLRDHERRAQFTVAQASFWRVSED
jgi:SAM-dependent methyltransferase